MSDSTYTDPAIKSNSQLAKTSVRVNLGHGYSGAGAFEDDYERERCAPSPAGKANWCRAKCFSRLTNLFFQIREEFLQNDKRVPRYVLDAKDHGWFWSLAAEAFNKSDDHALNFNFLNDATLRKSVRSIPITAMDMPYHSVTTPSNIKADFRDLPL